jgi:hypothetical protein
VKSNRLRTHHDDLDNDTDDGKHDHTVKHDQLDFEHGRLE